MKIANNIVLIGMMGCGKSTIGRLLAGELGYDFLDMDTLIEEKESKLIAEIFAQKGEEYFRQVESEVLSEALEKDNCVIACGGGVVENYRNIDVLTQAKNVFFLDAKPQILYDRIAGDKSRPKLTTPDEFQKLYMSRKIKYSNCTKKIVQADRNPIEVVQEIINMRNL